VPSLARSGRLLPPAVETKQTGVDPEQTFRAVQKSRYLQLRFWPENRRLLRETENARALRLKNPRGRAARFPYNNFRRTGGPCLRCDPADWSLCEFDIAAPSRKVCNRAFIRARTTLFQTFAVTYALMKIGIQAGNPDLAISFSNRIKRSAIKQAKEINRGWGKWEIAMFIISSARLLAKRNKLTEKVDMRSMM